MYPKKRWWDIFYFYYTLTPKLSFHQAHLIYLLQTYHDVCGGAQDGTACLETHIIII